VRPVFVGGIAGFNSAYYAGFFLQLGFAEKFLFDFSLRLRTASSKFDNESPLGSKSVVVGGGADFRCAVDFGVAALFGIESGAFSLFVLGDYHHRWLAF
jgi:hypothetical protein